jgi:cyclopropane-fatty-acyl-phospholipid synthase
MTAKLLVGNVHHTRFLPQSHSFSYPIFYLALDLKVPEVWPKMGYCFGFNRAALTSLWERDYLCEDGGPLLQQLERYYRNAGLQQPDKVYLVTIPRLLGYVFNPVSFYIAWHPNSSLHSILAEVNNTFGEKHLYLMPQLESAELPLRFNIGKEFYVSPFLPARGQYCFELKSFSDQFRISIEYSEGSERQLIAELDCRAKQLTKSALVMTLLRLPLAIFMVMWRIQYQALVLYFFRRVEVFERPVPFSPDTVRSRPGWVHKSRLWVLSLFTRRAGVVKTGRS